MFRAAPMPEPKYRRVLLKLSGEALAGEQKFGILPEVIADIAKQIKEVHELGVDVAIVIGGGNIVRGTQMASKGMDRAQSDYIGMLGTVINSLALQDHLERVGVMTRVQSAIGMMQLAEPYIRRRAMRHLEKRRVMIFAGGTGNPYFSTDTAAALRAMEIKADCILMAKKNVDGVYDDDPKTNPKAKRFETLTHLDALQRNLKVMDSTALSLCMDNKMPIVVFNFSVPGNVRRAVMGERIGTVVSN